MGAGPLARLGPFCQACVCPELLCELTLHSGRAGASGAQSAELQEPWGGKGSEWLLGVWLQACEPASQPAMSTKAALWAYFSQKWRQRSNIQTIARLQFAQRREVVTGQPEHVCKEWSFPKQEVLYGSWVSHTKECFLSEFSVLTCVNSSLFHPGCCLGLNYEQESSLLKKKAIDF